MDSRIKAVIFDEEKHKYFYNGQEHKYLYLYNGM